MRRIALLSLAVLALAGTASAQDDKSRKFLQDAMQGDNSEVMLGKLAAQQAGSDATKRYGQMLVDDHSMHLQKVVQVASAMNVPEEHQAMPAAEKERDKLMGMHGNDFDKEFAHYMVKDHRKDITEYQKASMMTGDVGKLARETLPTLHKHLSAAEKLAG